MPSPAELKAKAAEIATTVKGVDMAVDGSKEIVTASSTDEQIEKAVEAALPKSAVKKPAAKKAKKDAPYVHPNKVFADNVMKQAQAALNDSVQNNIAISNTKVAANG